MEYNFERDDLEWDLEIEYTITPGESPSCYEYGLPLQPGCDPEVEIIKIVRMFKWTVPFVFFTKEETEEMKKAIFKHEDR